MDAAKPRRSHAGRSRALRAWAATLIPDRSRVTHRKRGAGTVFAVAGTRVYVKLDAPQPDLVTPTDPEGRTLCTNADNLLESQP